MLQRIKDALNSSVTWLLLLLGGIFYLCKKVAGLENQLAEKTAEGKIQDAKEQVKEDDLQSDNAVEHYEQLRRQFLSDQQDKG